MSEEKKFVLKHKEIEEFIFNSTYSFLNGFIANWDVNKKQIESSLKAIAKDPNDKTLVIKMLTIAAYFAKNSIHNLNFMIESRLLGPAQKGWSSAYSSINWDSYTHRPLTEDEINNACDALKVKKNKRERALEIALKYSDNGGENVQ